MVLAQMPENKRKVECVHDFMYRKNQFDWMKGTGFNHLCHRVWSTLRAPFLLPPGICNHSFEGILQYCDHVPDPESPMKMGFQRIHLPQPGSIANKHTNATCMDSAWQAYDFNQAGCLLCGAMHICFDGTCPVQQNDEGYNICIISGMYVKELSFSNDEYVDTACVVSYSEPVPDCAVPSSILKRRKVCAPGEKQVANKVHSINQPGSVRCSVNKKNRYRSWVYHKVMTCQHPSVGKEDDSCNNRKAMVPRDSQKSSVRNTPGKDDADALRELIYSYVNDVLCGPKWKESMELEVWRDFMSCICRAKYASSV